MRIKRLAGATVNAARDSVPVWYLTPSAEAEQQELLQKNWDAILSA